LKKTVFSGFLFFWDRLRGVFPFCWPKKKSKKGLFKNYDYTALRRLFSGSVHMVIFDPFYNANDGVGCSLSLANPKDNLQAVDVALINWSN